MFKRQWIPKLFVVAAVIAVLAIYRLLPHPWNFTPVVATALFGGMYLRRGLSFVLPIGAMVFSDLFLGFDWVVTPAVYGAILVATLLGYVVMQAKSSGLPFILRLGGATFTSSIVFFVMTNFAVWLSSGMYPLDFSGLVTCYVMAIPFFGNTLAGDVVFISVFVAAYEGLHRFTLTTATESA